MADVFEALTASGIREISHRPNDGGREGLSNVSQFLPDFATQKHRRQF
jgi:hypothetical protein